MVWTGISLVVTFCVAYIIIVIVACAPWPSEHDGWLDGRMAQRCNDIAVPLLTAAAYFSVLTDFYILAIPLHQVPQLRLSRKRKVGISFIFLTGLLMAEINVGLVALSMPVVLAQFVGRLTDIGRSLSSWIRARRTPPHSVVGSESASDLAPAEAGADHAAQRPPGGGQQQQLPPRPIPNPTLSGMRKFIRNLQLSRAAASASRGGSLSGHGGATIRDDNSNYLRTFDDLTSADFSYHIQLKAMRASESTLEVERGGDKAGGTHSTREDGK
ncbi:NAD(P)-binding protein [Apiospora marii]|uniref:NAD(P)-binding protein n=1 Tax=Apiospora marii TaxID=335849 RepID=UPI003131AE62